jgi:hypothetical protein
MGWRNVSEITHRDLPERDTERASGRTARRLAASLRRAVRRATVPGRIIRRSGLLHCHRVVAVQTDLLEVAELLECAVRPDPLALTAVSQLLTDGLESPLFNRDVHPSELKATLYFVRSRLTADGTSGDAPVRDGGGCTGGAEHGLEAM